MVVVENVGDAGMRTSSQRIHFLIELMDMFESSVKIVYDIIDYSTRQSVSRITALLIVDS